MTQERVRNSRGKRAISVRAIEVLLYLNTTQTSTKESLSSLGQEPTFKLILCITLNQIIQKSG